MKLPLIIRKWICRYKGHDFTDYPYSTGYWSYDVEQAGYCERCGFDTHVEEEEE